MLTVRSYELVKPIFNSSSIHSHQRQLCNTITLIGFAKAIAVIHSRIMEESPNSFLRHHWCFGMGTVPDNIRGPDLSGYGKCHRKNTVPLQSGIRVKRCGMQVSVLNVRAHRNDSNIIGPKRMAFKAPHDKPHWEQDRVSFVFRFNGKRDACSILYRDETGRSQQECSNVFCR